LHEGVLELEEEFHETEFGETGETGEGEGILGAIGNVLGGLLGEGETDEENEFG
jgi:hypothetical protein